MTPADWQERLAPWIGSAVQVRLRGGGVLEGLLKSCDDRVNISFYLGGELWIGFDSIRAVWVQLVILEGGD